MTAGSDRRRRGRPWLAGRFSSRAEIRADLSIHVTGIAFALVAVTALWSVTFPVGDAAIVAGVVLYAIGLVAMVTCSAAYNLRRTAGRLTAWLRRLDHAAIFLMIAGTYSPVFLAMVGGGWGLAVFAAVWVGALAGITLKLLFGPRFETVSLALYLLLGWIGLIAIRPLAEALTTPALVLFGLGGLLYTAGVAFYLARGMPFRIAIWHLFVILGVATQFAALVVQVLHDYPRA